MACRNNDRILEISDLSVAYSGKTVLQRVSLDIPSRSVTALVGPSGCGKSSLLSAANRLIDLVPGAKTEGTVKFQGVDIRSPGVDLIKLRKQIGMIFQRPNPFPLSIRKNLDYPLREHGVRDAGERHCRIRNVLKGVGLWGEVETRLDSRALELSGGQQQRLCVARALLLEPTVLLMDEPCSSLDPLSSTIIEDLIQRLKKHYTVVIVTHNLAQAQRLADYVAVFWQENGVGRLVEHGSQKKIFEKQENEITALYVRGASG